MLIAEAVEKDRLHWQCHNTVDKSGVTDKTSVFTSLLKGSIISSLHSYRPLTSLHSYRPLKWYNHINWVYPVVTEFCSNIYFLSYRDKNCNLLQEVRGEENIGWHAPSVPGDNALRSLHLSHPNNLNYQCLPVAWRIRCFICVSVDLLSHLVSS